jgi:hypothetical protein
VSERFSISRREGSCADANRGHIHQAQTGPLALNVEELCVHDTQPLPSCAARVKQTYPTARNAVCSAAGVFDFFDTSEPVNLADHKIYSRALVS